jgi:hypothetical protein
MPCGRAETRCGTYHGRPIKPFEHCNLVAMFHLGLIIRAKVIPMGGANHVAKGLGNNDDEEDEGFEGKKESRDVGEYCTDVCFPSVGFYVFTVSLISLLFY